MTILRTAMLTGIAPAFFTSGAFAAETYVSLGLGIAEEQVEMSLIAPGRLNCNRTPGSVSCAGQLSLEPIASEFDLANAVASSASIGLEWESWRLELEYFSRAHDGQSLPQPVNPFSNPYSSFGVGAIGGLIEIPFGFPAETPKHEIASFDSHQLFLNAIYRFQTGVSWKPYIGVGAGVAQIRYRYIAEGIEVSFSVPPLDPISMPDFVSNPDWISLRSIRAIDAESRDNVLGFQFLAGIDRALTEEVTAFATLRWSRFESSAISNFTDNRPGLIVPTIVLGASSIAPIELDGIGGASLTAGIRYTF